jgi:hypothetical protein
VTLVLTDLRNGFKTAACGALAVGLLGFAACGDDEGRVTNIQSTETGTAATATETVPTETAPERSETTRERTGTEPERPAEPPASPEDQQGGAGDEIPASSQALITGRGGRLRPRVVRVPPFIAIRVELRSADGADYSLAGGGRRLEAGGELSAVSTTFAGLRPGKRLVLEGPQGSVTVEANAEPGP